MILGGEPTVQYALSIKDKLLTTSSCNVRQQRHHEQRRVWVSGYSNDVACYIPSERILSEGGYEGGESMLWYGLPARFAAGIESRIVHEVISQARTLAQQSRAHIRKSDDADAEESVRDVRSHANRPVTKRRRTSTRITVCR